MSGALDLAKELGLSEAELAERVVTRCVERVMSSSMFDEDGESTDVPSQFSKRLQDAVIDRVDKAIDAIASKHILPNVTTYLENLCLQKTNHWGEKTGEPVSFLEYLVGRAEKYMTEKVDYTGKAEGEDRYSSNWRGSHTRIDYLVHQHLHFAVETAMKQVVADGNRILSGALVETCKAKMAEIASQLKVEVKTR